MFLLPTFWHQWYQKYYTSVNTKRQYVLVAHIESATAASRSSLKVINPSTQQLLGHHHHHHNHNHHNRHSHHHHFIVIMTIISQHKLWKRPFKRIFFANLTSKVWNAGNFAMKIICVSFLLMLAEKGIATNLNLTRDVMCQLLVHRCRRNKLECRTWCIFQFKFVLRLSRFVNIHHKCSCTHCNIWLFGWRVLDSCYLGNFSQFWFFWLILYISCLESVLLRDWILSLDLQRDV